MNYDELKAKHYPGMPVLVNGELRFVIGENDQGVFQCCDSSGKMISGPFSGSIDPADMTEVQLHKAPSKATVEEKQAQELFKAHMITKGSTEKLVFEKLDDAEKIIKAEK